MPDGVRLSADLYRPTGGQAGKKLPVLLEYLPYRKHEARSRNWPLYSYFVQRGYVVAAVDIRGTGNSEGRLIPHEYSEIEQKDGESVIDWLSKQTWSNGSVGMFGISWGGFNSIQMAARHIPALKAIVAIDATEDLYQDDVHYMDGIMHLDSWEMSMDLDNARPGAPDYVVDDENFRNRFDTEPWMLTYKKQQRDGPFWDRASVRDRYGDIRIPTFHIGGWYDGYRDSVPRMLEHVKNAPVKAIMGAWHHTWPNEPYPRPRHGMASRGRALVRPVPEGRGHRHPRRAALRGVRARLASARPASRANAPGHWRYEDGWPIARIRDRILYPQPNHTLAARSAGGDDACTSLRAFDRLRGRRAGHVVGRRRARPARHGCLQPRLRQRPARGRPRDPRLAARDPDRRRGRDPCELDRAPLGRRAGRHGDAGRGRRHERHAPRTRRASRRRSCPASRSSSTSRCISPRGCSRRDTASGSRSTTRSGPCCGRRRSP